MIEKVQEAAKSASTAHREIHSSVSKVGKAIDRNFVTDYDSTSRPEVFQGPHRQKKLNEVVLQHFYREGRFEIADALAKEADLQEDGKSLKEPFVQLNAILESLRVHKNPAPALAWTQVNREALQARGSGLEMRLHELQFMELLKNGNKSEAILYARLNFPTFVHHHSKEIQTLMGCVMFADDLERSPYASKLLNKDRWNEVALQFVKEACALMGSSVDSPLTVAVNAGCAALPALLNIKQVMQQRRVYVEGSGRDELPIEIDLGPDCRYHSIFACPILRQQTTDANPPQRLTCGHCISRDALNKLSSSSSVGQGKVKCPYCPVEQNPNDARQITF